MLSPEQMSIRRNGITSTDIPAIVGESPWRGPHQVVAEKRGDVVEATGDRLEMGNILEPVLVRWFAEQRGVFVDDHQQTLEGPGIALATPDGLIYRGDGPVPIAGLEIKTHSVWIGGLYGQPETDQVPAWVLLQCAWGRYVTSHYYDTDIPTWWIVAFFDGLPHIYRYDRDDELEQSLATIAAKFWRAHIVQRHPVPVDGSEACRRALLRKYPASNATLREPTEFETSLLESARRHRDNLREARAWVDSIQNKVRDTIGDDAGLQWTDAEGKTRRVTWTQNEATIATDWQSVAMAYRNKIELMLSERPGAAAEAELRVLDGIEARYTTENPGPRVLRFPRDW